jgi:hypothetical protein
VDGLTGGLRYGACGVLDGAGDLVEHAFIGKVFIAGEISDLLLEAAREVASGAANAPLGTPLRGAAGGIFDRVKAGGGLRFGAIDQDVGSGGDAGSCEKPGERLQG